MATQELDTAKAEAFAGSLLGVLNGAFLSILISIGLQAGSRALGTGAVSSNILANAEHVLFGALILLFLIVEPRGLAALGRRVNPFTRGEERKP